MIAQSLRIKQLVDPSIHVAFDRGLSARLESIVSVAPNLELFGRELLRRAFSAAVERVLEANTLSQLLELFSKIREVRDAIESRDSTSIDFYEHSFRLEQGAEARFRLGELVRVDIPLQVRLDLELSGATLVI